MKNSDIIYIPVMHDSLLPKCVPAGLSLINPGLLPDGAKRSMGKNAAEAPDEKNSITLPGLPFNPQEARAVLRELLELGSSFGPNGDLKLLSGQNQQGRGWLEKEDNYCMDQAEKSALRNFADEERSAPPLSLSTPVGSTNYVPVKPEALQNAHKALLLAWNLEEHLIEISKLEQRFSEANHSLKTALGEYATLDADYRTSSDPDKTPAELPDIKDAAIAAQEFLESLLDSPDFSPAQHTATTSEQEDFFPGYGLPTPSWRVILDAAAAFLPEESLLLTCDPEIAAFLQERGMLQPLPEDLGEKLSDLDQRDHSFVSGLLWANLPLWRMLGYAQLPEDRPWLLKRYDLLVSVKKVISS